VSRLWQWVVRTILGLWVKTTIKPDDAAASIAARPRPVCYVLERESQTDLAALHGACSRLRLPRPTRRMLLGKSRADRAYFELERQTGFFVQRVNPRPSKYLRQLVSACISEASLDIDLVPVAIFWGRAPQKEASWWRLPLTEDWSVTGSFRKFLTVALNGRNTLIYFGEPVRIRDAIDAGLDQPRIVRRLTRTLRASFRTQRASTIGPDLSHRRTIVAQVLSTQAVRRAIRLEMKEPKPGRREILLLAKKYADEIAANYSQAFVTFMSLLLARLWNRLYDGVEFEHVDQLQQAGDGAEIIYVPCHRSHMDYLLLSYVIYRKGFAIPHIAAGINLNMPVIGRLLRKGGAFFLRRTFKGNPLYPVVFTQYLSVMMARGHSLEYFIEGGRSRTGRLLVPRTGMLSMTVHSYLRNPKRPVVFMPVYFGYERIVEGKTYLGELSGQAKKKESLFGLLRTLPALRQKFGKVHVNLGPAISLDAVLRDHNPLWERAALDANGLRAAWIADAVESLSRRIMTNINAAAAVTPINLVAMAMLATPRQVLPHADLVRQLELCRQLLKEAPYSQWVTITAQTGAEMVAYAESMGYIESFANPLGGMLRMPAESAVLATYYRNNVMHLFAMPGLLACCFLNNASMATDDIQRLAWRIYPYIGDELFLRWDEAQLRQVMLTLLECFERLSLLSRGGGGSSWLRPASTSIEAMQLSLLAQSSIQIVERYYLAIALLLQAGSGVITQDALEQRCHLMAQRMSLIHGLNSPEFFDKSLFRSFIDLLRRRLVVQADAAGNLTYGEALLAVAADAQLVLSEQIRHSILQVTLS
jgi:glycerol-3-phosphate O-acyltransferase